MIRITLFSVCARDKAYCSDPLEGGGTIYSTGFFLFREFSPLDIFIVES